MANLSIRKLDKNAYKQLQMRAAKHGVSMEEEVRRIIYRAIAAPEQITVIFQKYFGKKNGVNLEQNKRKPHEPMEFDE